MKVLRDDFTIPREVWPLVLVTGGVPLLFVLGLASFAWVLPGVVFGAAMLNRPMKTWPMGSGILLCFLVWIALSALAVGGGPSGLILFAYRAMVFASMAFTYMWICSTPASQIKTEVFIRCLSWMWLALVFFGYLAIHMPDLAMPSVLMRVLPHGLASQQFIIDMSEIRSSELQEFLGYPVPRPSAPLAYANSWGAGYALTFPFFILDRLVLAHGRSRRVGVALLVIGLVPGIISINRGMWIACMVAILYVAVAKAVRGDLKTFRRLMVGLVAVVAIVLVSPLGTLVGDRFSGSEASNETRASVSSSAVAESMKSPLIGHGAPQSVEDGPPLGTHGLIWYLMYVHGFVGLALFMAWYLGNVKRGLAVSSNIGLWSTSVFIFGFLLMPIYGMMPMLVVFGVAGAIVWRERFPETAQHPLRVAPVRVRL